MFARRSLFGNPDATIMVFIALNTAIELALFLADIGVIGDAQWRPIAYQNGAFWAGLLHNWRPNYAVQPWTMFVTYAFLHGGIAHLLGNMLTLWILGNLALQRVGRKGFLLIYTLSALGGGLGFGLLSISARPMVGASGALFGLIGAVLYWRLQTHRRLGMGPWPVLKSVAVLALLNLVMWVVLDGLLAWETHFGGFVAGWLAAAALAWAARHKQSRR